MDNCINLKTIDNNISILFDEEDNSIDVIILSSFFSPKDKIKRINFNYYLNSKSKTILNECSRILKNGGLIFIYGLPGELPIWGDYLTYNIDNCKMIFKYWIALDIDNRGRKNFFAPSHQGILMFLKAKKDSKNQPSFTLNTKDVRIPHKYCSACGQNVKDWGGKKHLMNPKGTCVSDVWNDLPKVKIDNNVIPDVISNRIIDLTTSTKKNNVLQIIQQEKALTKVTNIETYPFDKISSEWDKYNAFQTNEVYEGDSIELLKRIHEVYPDGFFDLAFADPPYNLSKDYNKYDDTLADKEYVDWCNKWLYGMYKTLKPGGSLFVLNLPKWGISHANFLNKYMDCRAWIVWNALSEPRGKMMPAHYALLYYTKPGEKPKFNYSPLNSLLKNKGVLPPDSLEYCLRSKCVKNRKMAGDNKKCELTDIWSDLHRIKHKRDRDSHPCQLPESLMERIILLTTNPGDVVFDPFGGAGTTAVSAYKNNRKFVICDIDEKYVKISRRKIEVMKKNMDLFGVLHLPKKSIKRNKRIASKKEVEVYLQNLARKLQRVPSLEDIKGDRPDIVDKIDILYPDRNTAIKRCKVVLV